MSNEPSEPFKCSCQQCRPEFHKWAYMPLVDVYDSEDSESDDGECEGSESVILWVVGSALGVLAVGMIVWLVLP